ncbi:glycosyltransferase [Sphingomonas sp.]|uniref:polysaccharide deacetylase family protein n=1 Tax=Sphingomonas sp. TaxID=28214 RepID=UPI0025F28B8E|nr:glycosyltransferase [Sphingomonas sp.]
MEQPIFYDASGRRRKWSLRTVAFLLALIVLAAIGLAASVVSVPIPSALTPIRERGQPRPIPEQIRHLRRQIGSWLPSTTPAATAVNQITVAFYVPWDPDSKASLERHIGQLDWLVPTLASFTDAGRKVHVENDPGLERILMAASHRPKVLPMVQNAANDKWDGAGMAQVLHDPLRRAAMLQRVEALVLRQHGSGVVYDIEELPKTAQADYLRFIGETKRAFASRGWLVTLAVPVDDPDWRLDAFAKVADRLFLMDYDEHSPGYPAGPIASQMWFVNHLKNALRQVPADKAIVAIGNYGYDWHDGTAENLTDEEAWLAANDSDAKVTFDRASGNSTFSYEENGSVHTIWMLDAASAWNQLRAADSVGVAGVALWRLGSEDPGVWPAFASFQSGKLPNLSTIRPVGNVDVEGNGELLRIEATPTDGVRHVSFDRSKLIRDQQFIHLPTPFVVRRSGYLPGKVALTFDDGPDPVWTPQILDILEAKRVPATFFVIGENALSQPGLLNRELRGGSEIGNHSYTHPNMAQVSPTGIRLELNFTQRLVEAYTGRAMRLFRAPYFGDAEPTTTDELIPALLAQQDGYLNVGLHVDPGDWKRPGVQQIIDETIAQVEDGSAEKSEGVILLHDGGGDRSQTIAALPVIIDRLRAKGYSFVPLSTMAGVSPQAIMPQLTGLDLLTVRADVGVFLFAAAFMAMIKWVFFLAIALGIARAVLMAGLAIRSRFDKDAPVAPPIDPTRFVSVLIPAFNEAKVIASSIRRVLASTDVLVEVIVIDDGSTDGTSAVVASEFGEDPRVRLLTLANSGKARALNQGMALVNSDVIIALDADTQFEAETVARLARWFADPLIGAVAGNAKVGNKVNLVTRWQAIEYVTAQNLERRALTQFDAITVVPGAVGAWRRQALDAVGGYPVDTLAEDQDLTIAIQRAGWRVGYDIEAVAWTEAPETLRALAKQRFRWAFGTLQCLWKHRAIIRDRKPAGLALVGIPQAWIFQIGFAMISPIIDLALVLSAINTVVKVHQHGWAQTQSDVLRMAIYWLLFTAIDVACGGIAYWLEKRETRYPAHLLVAQRFVYRQVMYSVVIRAVGAALSGPWVGWGKLERSGRTTAVKV